MKPLKAILLLFIGVLILSACGASRKVVDTQDEYIVYGYGESADRTIARTLAYQDCYQQMANKVNANVNAYARTDANQTSRYNGSGKKKDKLSTSTTMRTVTSSDVDVNGATYEIKERPKQNKWYVEIKMELPRDKVDEILEKYR